MNNRRKKIIEILNKNKDWFTGKQLADLFNVTSRTIRSDVESINYEMNDKLIISNKHYGYKINPNVNMNIDSNRIPQTAEERSIYILKKLLFENHELSIRTLQEDLFVSESTIEKEISKIRSMIKIYPDLEIKRTKNYIVIVGSETNKRKLYKTLLTTEINGNFINLNRLTSMFQGFDLIKVKNLFEEICAKYNFTIKEAAFPLLIVHIGISIDRIKKRNYIYYEEDEYNKESTEYKIAFEFYDQLRKDINLEVIESEISFLARVVIERANTSENIHVKEIDLEQFVTDILENIYQVYSIDVRKDEDLKNGLKSHLSLMFLRTNIMPGVENIFLNDLKKNYPMVFDVSIHIANYLQERLNCKISENEIGFIALHIGAAFDRIDSNSGYKTILIIPHNQTFAQLSSSKLTMKYGNRIQILKVFNYFEENEITKLCPDLVLTMIPFEHNLSIPVIPISIFINASDEEKILSALNDLDKKRLNLAFVTKIIKITSPKYFYKDLDLKTPESIIEYISNDLFEGNVVEESFKEKVLYREQLSPASLAYAISTPHAFGSEVKQSTIAIAFLKEAVQWGEHKVKIVLLLAVQEKDVEILKIFFEWLSNVIKTPELFGKFSNVNNYDEFILEMI